MAMSPYSTRVFSIVSLPSVVSSNSKNPLAATLCKPPSKIITKPASELVDLKLWSVKSPAFSPE